MNKIRFCKLNESAIIPTKEKYNAGYDIYANFKEDYIVIEPHTTTLIGTGIASVIPENYYMQICERGSTGSKGIKSSAGVIDSSYRGEWFLAVTNTNNIPLVIAKEDCNCPIIDENKPHILYPKEKALFQAIVHKVHNQLIIEEISVDDLSNYKSERGEGKLGSSGK